CLCGSNVSSTFWLATLSDIPRRSQRYPANGARRRDVFAGWIPGRAVVIPRTYPRIRDVKCRVSGSAPKSLPTPTLQKNHPRDENTSGAKLGRLIAQVAHSFKVGFSGREGGGRDQVRRPKRRAPKEGAIDLSNERAMGNPMDRVGRA